MEPSLELALERARIAAGDELALLLHHPAAAVLLVLLENPGLDEAQLSLLLARPDLSTEFLEEISRRRDLLKNYRVKRALAFHPHTPRLVGLRMVRELFPMDLAQLTAIPAIPMELRRQAEDHLLGRLPQLPLGVKITLARNGPARVAGALLAEGHPRVLAVALDNPVLTEAQVLRALSRENLPPAVVNSICGHNKWSRVYNVRMAMVRHPATTLSTLLTYLPELTVSDLRELAAPGIVPERLRNYLLAEIHRRTRRE